ncbi:hypothetical protein BDW42DRAFT_7462 [Aspergillus taichungensis]|uniref:Uncharacterized protein n=1 Tax=Aspergillus taichungensis TaxID=482145 RepID=A0A2J5HJ93_9EURO|nr:hypothetical protein BDW42DRAFT_7462 [Aspergillus taichungensis]
MPSPIGEIVLAEVGNSSCARAMADCAFAHDRLPMKMGYGRSEAASALTTSKPVPHICTGDEDNARHGSRSHGVTRSLLGGCYIGCLGASLNPTELNRYYGLNPGWLGFLSDIIIANFFLFILADSGHLFVGFTTVTDRCAYQTCVSSLFLKRSDHRLPLGQS